MPACSQEKEIPFVSILSRNGPPLQMSTPIHGPPPNPRAPEESNCTSPGGQRGSSP